MERADHGRKRGSLGKALGCRLWVRARPEARDIRRTGAWRFMGLCVQS